MENHTTYWQMSCSSRQKLLKSKREAQSLKAKSWNSTSSWHFSTENHITYWQMSCSQWGFMTNVAQKQKRSWQPESKILKLHKFTALFYGELYHLLTNELQSMGVHNKCCSEAKEMIKAWKQNLETPRVHGTYWQMSCSQSSWQMSPQSKRVPRGYKTTKKLIARKQNLETPQV